MLVTGMSTRIDYRCLDWRVLSQVVTHTKLVVTEEGKGYLAQGSPEAQVFNALPAEGAVPLAELKVMRWLG